MNSIQEGDVHKSEPTSRIRLIIEASKNKDRQRDHHRENGYKSSKPRDKRCNHNPALIDKEFLINNDQNKLLSFCISLSE
jgi:hypothetical protein